METGNRVKISTLKEITEGVLMESSDSGLYLIKLKSGYNIGIKKEDAVNIEEIKEKSKEQKKKITPKQNSKLPGVDMIITGGTISARLDPNTGGVSWLTSPEKLLEFYPELTEIVNIRKVKMPFMKASENMDYKDWQEIAKACEESLNDSSCQGVIITHGTDFLHYTSSALSFFLKNLNKPVVLTYSQRSSDRASSDARLNLKCAATLAKSDIAEVMLVGHASMNDDFCYAMKGCKVRKMHTSRRDAFKPINTRAIAKVWPGKIEILESYNPRNNKKVELDLSFNDKIALIMFHPGMEPEIFDYLSQRYQGIVLMACGLGHLAASDARKNLLPAIKKAIDNGLVIVASPQTIYGRLDPLVYSPGRILMKTGIIFLQDILAETAYVKLGFVLGHASWKSRIKEKMLENISGEFSERLVE